MYASTPSHSSGSSAGAHVLYRPQSAVEKQYCDVLFSIADIEQNGQISGKAAVEFFTRSNVPKYILREIWGIADGNRSGFLNRDDFYVAMRLISLAQSEGAVSVQRLVETQRSGVALPLPRLRDVPPPPNVGSGTETSYHSHPHNPHSMNRSISFNQTTTFSQPDVSHHGQIPPQSSHGTPHIHALNREHRSHTLPSNIQAASHMPPLPSGPYAMTETEFTKYEAIFLQHDRDMDGFVLGAEVVPLFQMSGLDRKVLGNIWTLADELSKDNKLDKKEFAVAMHLIVCVSKRNKTLPSNLPPELLALLQPSSSLAAADAPKSAPVKTLNVSDAFSSLDIGIETSSEGGNSLSSTGGGGERPSGDSENTGRTATSGPATAMMPTLHSASSIQNLPSRDSSSTLPHFASHPPLHTANSLPSSSSSPSLSMPTAMSGALSMNVPCSSVSSINSSPMHTLTNSVTPTETTSAADRKLSQMLHVCSNILNDWDELLEESKTTREEMKTCLQGNKHQRTALKRALQQSVELFSLVQQRNQLAQQVKHMQNQAAVSSRPSTLPSASLIFIKEDMKRRLGTVDQLIEQYSS